VQVGVNALAAPVLDHRGVSRGAIALVGATQFIPAEPDPAQADLVVQAAAAASRALGWRGA
jgi:DNA-binding IclR family transcriptional regulator